MRNLSRVSKINRRRFGQEEDTYYQTQTPLMKAKSNNRLVRPRSSYHSVKRAYEGLEFTNQRRRNDINLYQKLNSTQREVRTADTNKRRVNRLQNQSQAIRKLTSINILI